MNPTPLSTTGLIYGNPVTDTESLIIQSPIMTPEIRQVKSTAHVENTRNISVSSISSISKKKPVVFIETAISAAYKF